MRKININANKDSDGYFSERYTDFVLSEVIENEIISLSNSEYNHILIVLRGSLLIDCNEFTNKFFPAGQIVFLPAYSKTQIEAKENSRVLVGTFEFPSDVYYSKMMESLWELRSNTDYSFSSLPINAPMQMFLDLLIFYLESGVQNACLHELKEKEFFLLLRWYYSDEEFVSLLHPIIGKSLDFRTIIMKNYNKVKKINELAELTGMSRSNFGVKFNAILGMSPKQWIQERKAKSIKYYMTKPGVTISDIIINYRFESFSQFNRFCKKQFGAPPSILMKKKN